MRNIFGREHLGAHSVLRLCAVEPLEQRQLFSTTIVPGSTVTGKIAVAGQLAQYTFAAAGGDTFKVSVGDVSPGASVSKYHPFLQVTDPQANTVINAGAFGDSGTSVSAEYTVPAFLPGNYTIIVKDEDASAVGGSYDLEMVKVPGVLAADSNSDGGAIVDGQTRTGTINRVGDLDAFSFTASAGDSFTISLGDAAPAGAISKYHPFLEVFDPTGNRIVGTASAAAISASYAIPATGTGKYTIVVQDQQPNASGGVYSLKLTGTIHALDPVFTLTPPPAQSASIGVARAFSLGSFSTLHTIAPYTVDINWGDGTTDTKVILGAAGTIPAQTHAFAHAGTDTASIVVTDSVGNASKKETFIVTVAPSANTASISGSVFKDLNANGVLNTGEGGIAGAKVFFDTNKNGKFDAGEPAINTDASGNYKFAGAAAGTYLVRQILPTGYKLTAPAAGFISETIAAGKAITGANFADAPATASISGTVFNDGNVNKIFDPAELGLDGWQVFIDANNNGKLDTGDRLATTDINGNWSFTGLTAGTYTIRVVQVAKTATTTVGGAVQTIALTAGQTVTGKLFGEKRIA